jgi:hypothetical protein
MMMMMMMKSISTTRVAGMKKMRKWYSIMIRKREISLRVLEIKGDLNKKYVLNIKF